jgi:hypothetical protein
MLRIGASIANMTQLRATSDAQRVNALDELSGWLGDATSGRGAQGELALGGPRRLEKERKLAAYVVGDAGGKMLDLIA